MNQHLFLTDLQQNIRGDVLTDDVSLGIYATDASLYQIKPIVVLLPKDADDVATAVRIARDHKVAIVARGGGTGLAGQTIGTAMILDFSKYMNALLELNADEQWARVQPGLVRDNLNVLVAAHGLHFAPDPATSSRANVGGMMGNNSSGTKSILYGKTIDHVLEMNVLLSDGTILHLHQESPENYKRIASEEGRKGEIFRGVQKVIQENSAEIAERFPKVMRRVGGYNLDEFIHTDHWNLSKLIVGSEATLALILEAKINLEPLPKHKSVCLVHFRELNEAIRAVQTMVDFGPAAVEIIDNTVITLSRKNLTTQRSCHVIEGNPAAVLIVEFYGDTPDEVLSKPKPMVAKLQADGMGYSYPIYPEGPSYDDVWTIRKKGLGLMLGMKSKKKPIAFIEDAAIPLASLPQYIEEVSEVCKRNETEAAMYAHASVGVIHVRPILDLRQAEDIERFKNIAEDTFELVKKYKGSWSGEHGDGLVRSPFNERFFGSQIYHAFEEIKTLFDPLGLLNPGKKIHAPPIDHNLRYGSDYRDHEVSTLFHYRQDGSFHDAVHMCSGVGECRKTVSGTMCPSFMATRDEEHSTRGRANALRLAMSGQLNGEGLDSKRVRDTMDLCLSCKACKSECPSNVDMAKLKSEIWQRKYDREGVTIRERFIRDSSKFARSFSGSMAPLINGIQRSKIFRGAMDYLVGIEKRRVLPSYAPTRFTQWFSKHYKAPADPRDTVVLFVDTYLNYHEPSVGISTVKLLTSCGYAVELAEVGCCQRPKISNGFLRSAKSEGEVVAQKLDAFMSQGRKVLVCEPSCASALNLDIPDLLDDETLANNLAVGVLPVADFLLGELEKHSKLPLSIKYDKILMHGHCHEKALYGTKAIKALIQACGKSVEEVDSGCCGMAGSFGYEKEHYAMSEKIGNRRLFGAVRKSDEDTFIIANGFSCRHQLSHFTNRKARYWTELFFAYN
ncbi:MAG: FAD-binding protein [Saprospiraceae bacterium]|nr:FAD-binding protein [Saprospiraceae bacterium]